MTAWAGITGSISGVVTDPSGAVVPGVKVVATSSSTNMEFTSVTDAQGFYIFPVLNVDHYTIKISHPVTRTINKTTSGLTPIQRFAWM